MPGIEKFPGVAHSDDLILEWDHLDNNFDRPLNGADAAMSLQLTRWANILSDVETWKPTYACRMWTDFVKFGNPSSPGVDWTPVTQDFREWLEIGPTGQLEMTSSDSTFEARMEFWDSLFPLEPQWLDWASFRIEKWPCCTLRYIWPKGRDNQSLMGRADLGGHFRQGRGRYYSCCQTELHHLLTLFHFHPPPFQIVAGFPCYSFALCSSRLNERIRRIY